MQCPNCGFENIPNQTHCARCDAQLVLQQAVAPKDVMPPRAGWTKIFRPLFNPICRVCSFFTSKTPRRLIRIFLIPRRLIRISLDTKIYPSESVAAMLLSVIPGLGHLLTGRAKAALVAVSVWLFIFLALINFYSGNIGGLLAGLLISWHAVVVFDAGRVQQHADRITGRISMMLLLISFLGYGYFLLDRLANRYLLIVNSPAAIAGIDLQVGDIIVLNSYNYEGETSKPGDVVGFRLFNHAYDHYGNVSHRRSSRINIISRILAREGDKVEVLPDGLKINGKLVPREYYPDYCAPFPEKSIEFIVEPGFVFAPYPVRVLGRGRPITNLIRNTWSRTYNISINHIAGKASGVYLPFWRWHSFYEED